MPYLPPPPPAVACLTHRAPEPASLTRARVEATRGAGGSVASGLYPLVVHYDAPEYADKAVAALGYAELAWEVQVDQLGFQPPLLPDGLDGDDGGGPELDIYLADVGAWEGWAEAEVWADTTDGDGLAASPALVVLDRTLPDEWLGPYVVHEFNHVLQIATDLAETSLPLWEGTATAAQAWTLGADGRWDADVPSFQEAPWAPVLTGDSETLWSEWGTGFFYEYGAALWVMHLDVMAGGDGRVGPALWAATAQDGDVNSPDVIDAFTEVAGEDLGVALSRVARTRWRTGARWEDGGLPDAAAWGADEAVPFVNVDAAATFELAVHGQGFAVVDVRGTPGMEVAASVDADVGVAIAAFGVAGAPELFEVDVGRVPRLDLDVREHDQIVIAVTNLGERSFGGDDDPWTFSEISVSSGELAVDPSPPEDDSAGCGCSSAKAPRAGWLGWLVLVLAGMRQRRR